MKSLLTITLLLFGINLSAQYNYGLEVKQHDAKIEGKLYLESADRNIFVGRDAGISNTTGNNNSFFGYLSGSSNTTGYENSSFGFFSGFLNNIGFFNSFFGTSSGSFNTTGHSNSFFGHFSGQKNSTGNLNCFFGRNSGISNTTGNNNNFYGLSSGNKNTTGENNSFFGAYSGSNNLTGFNNIAIGNGAGPTSNSPNQSNRLYIDIKTNFPFGNDNPLIYGEFDNDLVRINGTLEVTKTIHISETAKLEPQTAEPSTCSTESEYGLMYYDSSSTTHKLKVCTNAGWEDLN